MDLAKRLQALMDAYGISQYRLAAETGLSQPFLSQVLKGKKNLSLETITTICRVFSITLSDFFRDNEDNSSIIPPYVRSFVRFCEDLSYDEVKSLRSMVELLPSKQKRVSCSKAVALAPVPGRAAAGYPLYSEIDDCIVAPEKYLDTDHYLIIQAQGDSMIPRVNNGDYVVAERNTTPANGEMALVKVDGLSGVEYMIKLFFDTSDGFVLRSLNPDYEPMTYDEKHVISAERIVYIIPR